MMVTGSSDGTPLAFSLLVSLTVEDVGCCVFALRAKWEWGGPTFHPQITMVDRATVRVEKPARLVDDLTGFHGDYSYFAVPTPDCQWGLRIPSALLCTLCFPSNNRSPAFGFKDEADYGVPPHPHRVSSAFCWR